LWCFHRKHFIQFGDFLFDLKGKSKGLAMRFSFWKTGICVAVGLLLLLGCVNTGAIKSVKLSEVTFEELQFPQEENQNVLVFGFDRRLEPKEDVKMYVSFLRYLEKATGYRWKLYISEKDGGIVHDLGTGKVHFAAIGTLSYLQAHELYGVRCLVRGLNAQGKDRYQAVIFTRPQSDITSLADLKGRTFAFGSYTSTQGHLIPRMMLAQIGIELKDLKNYEYTGSHADCANAVISGRYDAGGMQDTLARSLEAKGLIRILAVSDYYPASGISVNKDVPPKVVEKVKKALLAFDPQGKDAEGLYHWERSEMPLGFIEARDEDYEELRRWARVFGLLTPPPSPPIREEQ